MSIAVSPWIFTTDGCNLRCPYCFESHKSRVMSPEVWSTVSDHFIKLTRKGVLSHTNFRLSGGEPLTCFDSWREFPLYLKKVLGDQFSAGMLTNFTLLNEDIIHYIVKNDIGCGVSLDGTIHSKIDAKGESTSRVVMENIEWFLESGGRCNILTVLNDTNVGTGEILELAKFVAKHDLRWQTNSDYFCMVGNECTEQMYDDLVEAMDYLQSEGYDMGKFNFQFLHPYTDCGRGCGAGYSAFSIGTNGDVYPCQTCVGDPVSNILTSDNVVEDVRKQTQYNLGCNYVRPKACEPDNCSASFQCKGSCRLNMKPSDDNPKCQLIRKIHQYFIDRGLYAQ